MAEITQEQVEREKLFERSQAMVDGYYGRLRAMQAGVVTVMSPPDPPLLPQSIVSDIAELLRLARLATPELVALGKAAVEWANDPNSPGYESAYDAELHEAARLYAQSIKGEDHGK